MNRHHWLIAVGAALMLFAAAFYATLAALLTTDLASP